MTKDIDELLLELKQLVTEFCDDNGVASSSFVERDAFQSHVKVFIFEENSVKSNHIFNEIIDNAQEVVVKRGKYRKKEERPDPNKPPDAEVNRNRTTQTFSARISPDHIKLVDTFCAQTGKSKREIVERALSEFIEHFQHD